MVLKLRCAIGLALIAGVLTLMIGLTNGARSMTLFYRILVSLVLFGVLGYIYGFFAEKYWPMIMQLVKSTALENDAVVAEALPEPITGNETTDEADLLNAMDEADLPDSADSIDAQPSFIPLTPDRLETVPRSPE